MPIMTPFSTDTAAAAGARGGSRMTEAKQNALAALHAGRKGVRQARQADSRDRVLEAVRAAVCEPVRGLRSVRVVAAWCHVSDRTVRRWLSGEDWPPIEQVHAMEHWLRSLPAR